MSLYKSVAAFGLFAAGAIATPAAAVVTFASFSSSTVTRNVRFISGDSTSRLISTLSDSGTTASAVPVIFSIFGSIPTLQGVASTLTLDATVPTETIDASGPFSLSGLTGSFSIMSNSVVTIGSFSGSNMLSGTFSGPAINGTIGGGTGGVTGSTVGGASINFTSDFLDFSNVVASDLAFALSAINDVLGTIGDPARLASFRATLGGQFSSDPAPRLLVPEPATWAMLVLGFGLVGVSVRRRRHVVVA